MSSGRAGAAELILEEPATALGLHRRQVVEQLRLGVELLDLGQRQHHLGVLELRQLGKLLLYLTRTRVTRGQLMPEWAAERTRCKRQPARASVRVFASFLVTSRISVANLGVRTMGARPRTPSTRARSSAAIAASFSARLALPSASAADHAASNSSSLACSCARTSSFSAALSCPPST